VVDAEPPLGRSVPAVDDPFGGLHRAAPMSTSAIAKGMTARHFTEAGKMRVMTRLDLGRR